MLLLVKLWDRIKDSQDLILWPACGWRWCLDTWANSSGTFLRSFAITSYAQLSKSQFVWGPGHRDCCHTQSSSSAVPQAARPASEKIPEDSFSYVRSMWIYVWLNNIQCHFRLFDLLQVPCCSATPKHLSPVFSFRHSQTRLLTSRSIPNLKTVENMHIMHIAESCQHIQSKLNVANRSSAKHCKTQHWDCHSEWTVLHHVKSDRASLHSKCSDWSLQSS